jgi:hypothetical protein
MQKFTVFTVILTIIIVIVLAEMFASEYLPSFKDDVEDLTGLELTLPESLDLSEATETNVLNEGLTNKLGADVDYGSLDADFQYEYDEDMEVEEISLNTDSLPDELPVDETAMDAFSDYAASSSDILDFENENFVDYSRNVYLREDQIKSAGFVGAYLEQEPHNGYLYKTIQIDDLFDVEVTKSVIRTEDSLFAKVYVFTIGPNAVVSEVYQVLKMRGAEGLDIELNETNEYGDGSFYMNDARRSSTAFLTVRFGELIYGFSYPKEYHSQIKNLIALIDMEF